MDSHNTMERFEFVIWHIVWVFVGMLWYNEILFRCVENYTFIESKLILWGLLLFFSILGICFGINRKRNGFSVFLDLAAAYGGYTALAYLQIRKTFIIAVLAVVTVLSATYIVIVMSRKIKNRNKLKKIMFNRAVKAASAVQVLFGLGFTLIIVVFGGNIFFGSTIMKATVDTSVSSTINEQTIANHIDTIILLQEDSWSNLTVKERLDILQIVANIERRYLGLPNELNVGAANLSEGVKACYFDTTHEIVISMDSLLNDSSREVLNSVCHEAYHSYQYRMVQAYQEADEAIRNLQIFRKAGIYAEEFSNYIVGEEDFYGYYYQDCESDARDYAEDSVNDYYQKISEYLLETTY